MTQGEKRIIGNRRRHATFRALLPRRTSSRRAESVTSKAEVDSTRGDQRDDSREPSEQQDIMFLWRAPSIATPEAEYEHSRCSPVSELIQLTPSMLPWPPSLSSITSSQLSS